MRLHHAALRVLDLEASRAFYETWFCAKASPIYRNPAKGYASYFLHFPDGGASLELQYFEYAAKPFDDPHSHHLAFELDTDAQVTALSEQLRGAGVRHLDGPRLTGDGFFEAAFLDPDGHRFEITSKK